MTAGVGSPLLALPGHDSPVGSPRKFLAWLEDSAVRYANLPAVEGIDCPPLTHTALYQQVRDHADALLDAGLGRADVVLIILPNGPQSLTAMLAVAAVAVALPVAIEEPAEAIEQLLAAVAVRAVLFDVAHRTLADELCKKHGLTPLATCSPPHSAAGQFAFVEPLPTERRVTATRIDDAAVLTRTSGTTAEPRIVAWSQASLYRSSDTVAAWMALGSADRSLCVMPFAHLHSLVRSCMPGLLRGGCVIVAPGFDRRRVFEWVECYQPSYMTAVPAIYRMMLDEAEQRAGALTQVRTSLRLLAAGSDRLDEQLVQALSSTFNIPVREFYGMSEVSPMLAATPSGRLAQAGGTLGLPCSHWRIEIRGQEGRRLPSGEEGEIAARGGLFNPIVARTNTGVSRITDGWYLTGDRGFIDSDGLLHVCGRMDERITRGGKKVAPEAVEAIIDTHPAVIQSIVFPIPDAVLGARVGALVIANGTVEEPLSELQLRAFLADRLPDWMVPERVAFVDEIPHLRSGKASRRAIGEQFAQSYASQATDAGVPQPQRNPHTPQEAILLDIVKELLELELEVVDLTASFDELGIDSFLATSILVAIEERFGVMPTPGQFLEHDSIERLANLIANHDDAAAQLLIVKVQQGEEGPPLFFTHAPTGYPFYAQTFARYLDPTQAIYALGYADCSNEGQVPTMERHAAQYVSAIREIQSSGPYLLAGHSFGAQLAFEIAHQLSASGQDVAFLGLMDDEADLFKRKFAVTKRTGVALRTYEKCRQLLDCYVPKPFAGDIDLFVAELAPEESFADPLLGWGDLALGQVTCLEVPGDHTTMMSDHMVARWAGLVGERIQCALQRHAQRQDSRAGLPERPDKPDVIASIAARTAGRQGNLAAEITAYRQAIKLNPEQPYWVYRNLGDALKQSGDAAAAIDCWRKGAEREAIPVVGHTRLAEFLHKMGRRQEALALMEAAINSTTDVGTAQIILARTWLALGRPELAETHARQALAANPEDTRAMTSLGRGLGEQGRFPEAIEVVERWVELCPNQVNPLHELASLYTRSGKSDAAVATLHRTVSINPASAPTHFALSQALEAQGSLDAAILAVRQAIEITPADIYFRLRLGRLLIQCKELTEAEQVLRQVIEMDEGLAAAHERLSHVLELQGRAGPALEAARRALQLAPEGKSVYLQLGLLLTKSGDLAEAESILRQAITMDATLSPAHHRLSHVLQKKGLLTEAILAAQHAVELAPQNKDFQRRLMKLESLASPD